MRRSIFAFAVCLLAVWAMPLLAVAKRSTPEERKRAVEAARLLEEDPLGEKAKGLRGDLLKWWIEVPDLTLTWCAGMLLELDKDTDKDFVGAIVTQAPLSAGAAMIDHPELAKNKKAFAIAGVEGALRAYRSVILKEPGRKNECLEGLQKEGALEAYVDSKLPACK
jgi:hypothetical protein